MVGRRLRSVILLGLLPLLWGRGVEPRCRQEPLSAPVTERPTPSRVVVIVRDSGFHWADAGVGAAAMLATAFLALGVALVMRPDRRSNRGREAASSARREGS